MYEAKIIDIKRDTLASGQEFLDVHVQVLKSGKEVDVRKFGMDVESTDKEVKEMVKKFIDNYNHEAELAVEDAKKQAKNNRINKTISKVKGETIK